jgi:DNA processing protein
MDDRWTWVALALVPGVGFGTRRYHALLELGEPPELFRQSHARLAGSVGDEVAGAIRRFDVAGAAAGQAEAAARCGARLLTRGDAEYPAPLAAIPEAPPFLFVRGSLRREDGLAVAIVGSRRATGYGLRVAERLAADLALRGVAVVSGLARGIDTAAHRGALAASGRTLAVLGNGIDVAYPAENRPLLARIAGSGEHGAVLSECPMGTPPLPQHFPMRNRVIAGLALGAVVVEAAERSGALITARLAGELSREVYAVPGNVGSPVSEGTNRLIQDGAKLVRTWEDVVAEWPAAWRQALRPVDEPGPGARPRVEDGPARRLLTLIGEEPVGIDAVIERSGFSSSQVAQGLTSLELCGLVRQLPGQRYLRQR